MKKRLKIAERIIGVLLWFWLLYLVGQLLITGTKFLEARGTYRDKTEWDVVLECQKISAQATNEGWGYASCLEALEEVRPKDEPTILKV